MKLLTQIGLTYLKPRNVAWAFYRKTQSLHKNLELSKKTQIKTNTAQFSQVKSTDNTLINKQTSH